MGVDFSDADGAVYGHTCIMRLYQHGMDLTLVSQWLGHTSLDTALVYAHADTEAKRKVIEKIMDSGNGDPESFTNYAVDDEDLKQLEIALCRPLMRVSA